jgi:patatin-like phospholipase/acyl hydrolase
MPELLRIFGLRFFFYSNDHNPPHIHVRNADGEARFTIEEVNCIENAGLKNKDINLSISIIEENKDLFLQRWNEFFNK